MKTVEELVKFVQKNSDVKVLDTIASNVKNLSMLKKVEVETFNGLLRRVYLKQFHLVSILCNKQIELGYKTLAEYFNSKDVTCDILHTLYFNPSMDAVNRYKGQKFNQFELEVIEIVKQRDKVLDKIITIHKEMQKLIVSPAVLNAKKKMENTKELKKAFNGLSDVAKEIIEKLNADFEEMLKKKSSIDAKVVLKQFEEKVIPKFSGMDLDKHVAKWSTNKNGSMYQVAIMLKNKWTIMVTARIVENQSPAGTVYYQFPLSFNLSKEPKSNPQISETDLKKELSKLK